MQHSGTPHGWKFNADPFGNLQLVRDDKRPEKELGPLADLLLQATSTAGALMLFFIAAAVVLHCYGIPFQDIPALLGIHHWSIT